MALRLDPKLQRIIDDAGRNAQLLDTPNASAIPVNFAHTSLNRDLAHAESLREPSFMAVGFQAAHAALDDFDRNILQSDNGSKLFDSTNSFSQLQLPPTIMYKNPKTAKTLSPFIYGHQITQQEPEDGGSYLRALRASTIVERLQGTQTVRQEPTGIFHGVEKQAVAYPVYQAPTTPLNPSSFVCSTAGNDTTTSSEIEASSPSTRITLRRMSNRPPALKLPQMPQSDLDEELLLNTPPQVHSTTNIARTSPSLLFTDNLPTVQGIQLVSPHELPDRFRQVFRYELFNAVQSKCFGPIYNTTDNVVVAAPTGSGKTAILELAICSLVREFGSEQFKIVYLAPTKSLCSERVRDWERKFSSLNLLCVELTGDTDNSEMRKVGHAAIIVTTPEKWDSITRKWKDHIKLLQLVRLVLIDEVHILKDPRGATLEAVVSRMKSIGAKVRFIALSATVPNSEDIAMWLGKDHTNGHLPAHRETFGEEFRPVKLQKHVYGFNTNINDFAFDTFLDTKLPGLIVKHTIGKPMMVFCVTRKICESTARKLAAWWSGLRVTERPWPIPNKKVNIGSPELRELVGCGVAFHHAGLDAQDRSTVETGFLRDGLSVICCTSTLAVGINLPCHLVVIKNTVCYKDTGLSEYSDLEVMQMLGRAGRPQFDNSASAIIMTRTEKVDRYKLMISGQDILESTLHLNLIEHLNSEIGLGTVNDIYSAKRWLAGTFLSVRMRKNPTYYKLDGDTGSRNPDQRLEEVCERDIELLKNNKLITEDQRFTCTEYGQAMAKYMVQFATMKLLLSLPKNALMTQILHIISQSPEFKDLRMKPNERASFREFNKSPFIKSPIKENISTFAHKVSLIIQIHLGGVELPMSKEFNIIKRQFQSEKSLIFDRVLRLTRCVVECKAYERDAFATCNAMELLRSIAAGYWENTTLQLRQLPNIGPAALRKLVQSEVKNIRQLAAMDSAEIERVMSRNPPFGKKILDIVANFPRLTLQAEIEKNLIKAGESVKIQAKARVGYLNGKFPIWNRKAPTVTFTATLSNGNLAHIWRGSLRRLEKGFDIHFTCDLSRPNDAIVCQLACEEIIGTIRSVELKPNIPASAFPKSEMIFLPAKTASDRLGSKAVLSTEEEEVEAEIITALAAEEDIGDIVPGTDYGGDSDFNDFVDIDDLDISITVGNAESEAAILEPVQMENGKWRCNHKCRDMKGIYLTKNGEPCKHLCCREGLDKPRRIQKKKVAQFETVPKERKIKSIEEKARKTNKPPKDTSTYKLRIAEHPMSFSDVEEIDLADEQLEVESAYTTQRHYPPTPGVLSIEGKPGSVRISKKGPQFSYTSGLQPNMSLIGRFDYNDQGSPDFPPPSLLLGNEDEFGYDPKQDSEAIFPPLSYAGFELPVVIDTAASAPASGFEHNAFGSNPFEALETFKDRNSPLIKKRPASPSQMDAQNKIRRVAVDDASSNVDAEMVTKNGVVLEVLAKKSLPAWVADFDQDIIAFFGDSVEYKE